MTSTDKGFAVVTGASSGIGKELAKQLMERNYDVLATAEDQEINDLNDELGSGVQTTQIDLRTYEGVEELVRTVEKVGRPVDVAAINAGIGVSGAFATDTSLDDELDLIALNVTSTTHLAKRMLSSMVARDSGRVLFTSSIAGAMPGPFDSVYAASKAYIYSLSLGIRGELAERNSNVSVTALMPGATETEFFERAGMEDTKLGASKKDSAADVAKDGLDAMFEGKDHVIAGSAMNKIQAGLSEAIPDRLAGKGHSKMAKPGSADQSSAS